MALQPFRFKKFSVAHDRCTHKVGTDAVLLGAWSHITPGDNNILDIGTGSGIIALMLAQRTADKTMIDAIELHPEDAAQARENVAQSPWPDKITVHLTAAQSFFPEKRYDLIVSNPPYFSKSLLPPDSKRSIARHTADLSFEDLLKTATRLLKPSGRFAVILPPTEALCFTHLSKEHGLFPSRISNFRSRIHKPIERILLELISRQVDAERSEITLYKEADEWSAAYCALTKDFYLRV